MKVRVLGRIANANLTVLADRAAASRLKAAGDCGQ